MALPDSRNRVPAHTKDAINRRIDRQMRYRLEYYARHPQEIDERLRQLDREWDVERALEANAASIGLIGLLLALLRGRRYLLLPLAVCGFLLQHALQGWCPPLAIFRRLGLRTRDEIAIERQALKILRGDFKEAGPDIGADQAVTLAHR
jgi:hypothetical protein